MSDRTVANNSLVKEHLEHNGEIKGDKYLNGPKTNKNMADNMA